MGIATNYSGKRFGNYSGVETSKEGALLCPVQTGGAWEVQMKSEVVPVAPRRRGYQKLTQRRSSKDSDTFIRPSLCLVLEHRGLLERLIEILAILSSSFTLHRDHHLSTFHDFIPLNFIDHSIYTIAIILRSYSRGRSFFPYFKRYIL